MRKTSAYARKKKFKAPAPADLWLAKIKDNKPYSSESFFGEETTLDRAKHSLSLVQASFSRIDNRVSPADSQEDFELLVHAVTVAQIRTYDIGGPGSLEALNRLNEAIGALDRLVICWREHKQWAVTGQDALILQEAVDIYGQILMASTPHEMQEAQTTRLDWLNRMQAKRKKEANVHLHSKSSNS